MAYIELFGVNLNSRYSITGKLDYLNVRLINHQISVLIHCGSNKYFFTDSVTEYDIDKNGKLEFHITSDFFDMKINQKMITVSEREFKCEIVLFIWTYNFILNAFIKWKPNKLIVTKILQSDNDVYEILSATSKDLVVYLIETKIRKNRYSTIEIELDPDTTDLFKTECNKIISYF